MARRNWEDLNERYRARLARYGITPSYYESGGKLQLARGHKPREHVTRRERNPAGLTSSNYRFLKRQQIRATPKGATSLKDFTKQTEAFKRLPPAKRMELQNRVAAMSRQYKRGKSKSWQSTSDLKSTLRQIARAPMGGGGGGGGGFYDDEGEDFYGDEPEDYEPDYYDFDNYEDDFPDFDDLEDLLFYH